MKAVQCTQNIAFKTLRKALQKHLNNRQDEAVWPIRAAMAQAVHLKESVGRKASACHRIYK
jgi:hypothetical protein